MPRGDRRQEIMQAAEKLFSRGRFHEVTLDQVAKVAKVGKGTIYRYFRDKEDLVIQTAMSGFDEMCELLEERVSDDVAFEEQLRTACCEIVQFFSRRWALLRVMKSEEPRARRPRGSKREHWIARRGKLLAAVAGIIERGVESGSVRSDVSPEVLAGLLLGMLRTRGRHGGGSTCPPPEPEVIVDVFCRGACAPAGAGSAPDSSGRVLLGVLVPMLVLVLGGAGCRTPADHRVKADVAALEIITAKQAAAFGRTESFDVERPSDRLRRKLMTMQGLAYAVALGSDGASLVPGALTASGATPWESDEIPEIGFMDALRVGARNARDYQDQKESVFRAALDLDLERNAFRKIFGGKAVGLLETDLSGDSAVTGGRGTGTFDVSKKLVGGAVLSGGLAVDIVSLLTQDKASSLGLLGDATVSIPLLRGSGREIVTEPLTQGERDVAYVLYDFQRFRRTFAVRIASSYYGVLREFRQLKNTEQNYRGLIAARRRARRLADSGRLQEFQCDQAIQKELSARDRWIKAQQSCVTRLDQFKMLTGLPPDAKIKLDVAAIDDLKQIAEAFSAEDGGAAVEEEVPPADAEIVLVPPDRSLAGPLEIPEKDAVRLALENRLDLRVRRGRIDDARRAVRVAEDRLRAELTLLGKASAGERRSTGSATSDDAKLNLDDGRYSGLLTLDLPLERTAERVAYRKSLLSLERSGRAYEELEDQVKVGVRTALRSLLESRGAVRVQAQAVALAERRVKSTNLLLQAGRAQIRELLDSQEDLLSAQNALTSAVINYRLGELELQRDMGVLEISEDGLLKEYEPEDIRDE